ncbi:MAG TPA: tyrosine-type recombinase/integrase [Mariprofundaceae bacterium]|nr:tyrosine-type recombinase/integrase [Mariprofundaceae bacterium]
MINNSNYIAAGKDYSQNEKRLRGSKPPFKLQEVWVIRIRLQLENDKRGIALFNLAIDSKLRGCDLIKLHVSDIAHEGRVMSRATVIQQKTGQPARFELTEQTQDAVKAWIAMAHLDQEDYLFPSRIRFSLHISTRQYARIVKSWASLAGLDPTEYGTHSLRRTKVTLIYRRTKTSEPFNYSSDIQSWKILSDI